MFTPALTTYTFYADDVDKQTKIDALVSIAGSNKLLEANILNFSKSMHAFNYIFGGGSEIVPLSSQSDIDFANKLLGEKVIHAFCAGKIDANRKPKWYYSGFEIAVALIMSENLNINVSQIELGQAIHSLDWQELDKSGVIITGFEGVDISSQINGINSSLEFVVSLKEKCEKKYIKKNKLWPC